MAEAEPLPKHRLVYCGPCMLLDKKPGERWATEAMARAAASLDNLHAASSPFGKGKRAPAIGGIYEMGAVLGEDGKPVEINRAMTWEGMLNTDALAAAQLIRRGEELAARAKRAEDKARKHGPADRLLDQLARVVATVPITDMHKVVNGFASDVLERAFELQRKARTRR